MLRIIVLGSAAGGGLPQWNCNCQGCQHARENPDFRSGQTSLAVSADGDNWFLINASPDLRQQVTETPALHPRTPHKRHSPIAGVILTNAEVDAVAGLLSMREGSPFGIFAHPEVLGTLAANSIFDVLKPDLVPRVPIAVGEPFELPLQDGSPSGLVMEAFSVPGKPAWYLEETATGTSEGDSLGLRLGTKAGEEAFIIPGCGAVPEQMATRIRGAQLVFLDGTVWTDDEMIKAGLSQKTGQRMGHISMSGEGGAIDALKDLDIRQKVFVHINNSNPALLPGSPERQEAERAGWQIAAPGMEFQP